ncbi:MULTISPECIES: hypothetical protein [Cellulophaga]|uniref:DinB-like domain-containing protein n=1 Tax=Cellulophaga lytica (strain ATCC 23178 / DSM 7489 / JCM 8516 / NBRC 14961 / NCIMB 1423 / VKM B-1433 / Cy l20) TaxID=867900 RepID=F0RIK7_CELLC|nr:MULTISPECIES: hypothetical protein [Cellulophaga]ADY30351.1 hypothetical protein Celly_2534 [Cellulophaga lytica DSM 7489]AIM61339.1 hypothetical protein IX49_12725 [Cellulophaga lytica]MDO6854572.1 hypothetical protein [Cellulophaga lytica]TVZ10340.1 hypothetical protein JM80_2878 [Cellulophaga sp. RHA_52]WQG78716.1 hypothetical protein SR888_07210 [Cellulophaga lytica]
MQRNYISIILTFVFITFMNAQEQSKKDLPYYQIPESPKEFTAGTVAARTIDALGFRYYWATEGLRSQDLAYKPNKEGRSTGETVDHIYGLSKMILKTTSLKVNEDKNQELTFKEKRKRTLENFKKVSDILKNATNLEEHELVFNKNFKLPFWNAINGPITDAIWHSGQIVVMRRSSGNPMPKGVNVLLGTKK